jgi:hypothetical protein
MATRRSRLQRTAVGAGVALLLAAHSVAAQDKRVVPTNQTVISGYGTIGYSIFTQGENTNAFTSRVAPVFLFQFQDRVLFEAELEFELAEGVTETGLEYAQLDFLLNDNITLVGGKFLVPFGVFGERIHPTWINKFPTSPPVYGHDVVAFAAPPLLPILADLGIMARGALAPGRWQLALSGYVTQGPSVEPGGDPDEPAELEFLSSSRDNNTNKMLGGRLDIALPPWFEVNVSLMNGDYDDNNVLDYTGINLAGELRAAGFEFRGEYIQTRQEIETLTGFPTVKRHGVYAQLTYRVGPFEPVVRWTQVFGTRENGTVADDGARQAGLALDYWFNPSIAFMVGYEINREDGAELDNNRLVTHIAFGF